MIAGKQDLIRKELEDGTGAAISVALAQSGLRSGMRIWFTDLDERHGPMAELRPHGLKAHRVTLTFGTYSGGVIRQIATASPEDVQLARALVASIDGAVKVDLHGQDPAGWTVTSGGFRLTATIRHEDTPDDDVAVVQTCREVIVPLMAAMAELIGYNEIQEDDAEEVPAFEGAVLESVVKRRERNPRNRVLCIRLKGERCAGCGLEPRKSYGSAGAIIEVHHLEPLSLLQSPRPYDPAFDLVPLCPNCHRAVHTRRPVPLSLAELTATREAARE